MNTVIRSATFLQKWLYKGKVIILTGARQVGKTTLLKMNLAREQKLLWLNADDASVRERLSVQTISNLKGIVGKYKVVVIDEVQRIKDVGLLLKLLADNFKQVQVIATGSSAVDISETIFEPLTGRHVLFHLYPFALAELYAEKSTFEIEQELPFHAVYGGYPEVCLQRENAEVLLQNLSNQYLYKDVLAWKDIRKPQLLEKLLQLLSYQVGSEVSVHELAIALKIKPETVESYMDLLEKSFVIFRLRAFSTNARKEVTKMSKVYFWDNGIRNAVIGNYDALHQRQDKGALWENLMVSERMKMNTYHHPHIKSYFWRNYNQSEVDYVELNKKNISAFEMKWNVTVKAKVPLAFTNSYPNAATDVITPQNFYDFCRIV